MNCFRSKSVVSTYKLCVGWQHILLSQQGMSRSYLFTLQWPFNINATCNLRTCLKYSIPKQLLHLHTIRRKSNHHLNLFSKASFSSHDYDLHQDGSVRQKRKVGLKMNVRRKGWTETEKRLESIIDEKGVTKWDHDDWIELSEKLADFTICPWEVFCMMFFFRTSNLALGQSLMDFVFSKSGQPPRLLTTYFIGLLGVTSNGDKAQEEKMKSFYDRLITESDIIDMLSMEVLTNGLCYTQYYRECLKLISAAKETDTLSPRILVNSLRGGLIHHDRELCAFIYDQMDDDSTTIFSTSILAKSDELIEKALAHGNHEGIRQFFSFSNKMGLTPKLEMALAVAEHFERNEPGQWQATLGRVYNTTGRCSACGQGMTEVSISSQEFKAIQSAFLDQVIVSDNVFYKSTPEEVQRFIEFQKEEGPFDAVVDGLNLIYSIGSARRKKGSPHKILEIESYFTKHGGKVLILGNSFLKKVLRNEKLQSPIFTTATTNADDAFFLYAALQSGQDTLIISADKLRDHKFKLSPDLRPIFNRWLNSIQVFDFYLTRNDIVLERRNMDLGPVEDDGGWHLPYDDTTDKRPFGQNSVICLRHGPENFIKDTKLQYGGSMKKNREREPQKRRQFSQSEKKEHDSVPWYEE